MMGRMHPALHVLAQSALSWVPPRPKNFGALKAKTIRQPLCPSHYHKGSYFLKKLYSLMAGSVRLRKYMKLTRSGNGIHQAPPYKCAEVAILERGDSSTSPLRNMQGSPGIQLLGAVTHAGLDFLMTQLPLWVAVHPYS